MAGRGREPKAQSERRNHHEPGRGEWNAADGVGWQHGETPAPPDGLKAESIEAWRVWMGAWFAAHWTPDDLPGLRTLVLLYDQVQRGEFQRANEVRLQMDTYGITPKGQQDRRWARPSVDGESPTAGVRQVRARKLKAV
jgi:hypothetical protein